MNATVAACLAFCVLMLYALASLAVEPITLNVQKRLGLSPMTTEAEIRIPRHADNREVCVALAGPQEDLGCWQLAGETSSPVFHRTWSHLPSGQYVARASLLRGQTQLFSNAVSLTVLGEEP